MPTIPVQHLHFFCPRCRDNRNRLGVNHPFKQQIGKPRKQFVVVASTRDDLGQMRQDFNPVFRVLITDFSQFSRFERHFFKRRRNTSHFRFRFCDMKSRRTNHEVLPNFNTTCADRLAREK